LIDRLCVDPDLRESTGTHAADTARAYTWQRNAEEMKRIFEEYRAERQNTELSGKSAVALR
jgi:hypothetical protein